MYWTGAIKNPIIGQQQAEPTSNSDLGKRKNQKISSGVERLEVAASGEMAWEYSNGLLEYDIDGSPSRHVAFKTALLRVWKKVGGEWKQAAIFVRSLNSDVVPAK